MEALNKTKVLYIDDDKDNLTSFKYQFSEYYDLHLAESAKEGYEILKKHNIPIIIADQRMPDMTGTEFFEKILPEYPKSIRMILTGFSDISAVIDGINKGQIYHYLQKPWREEEIKLVVNNAIESHDLICNNENLLYEVQKINEELRASLKEKELLLKENHHRVKNNMQLISSLLYLQSEKAPSKEVKKLLAESHNRIKALFLVHEKIYTTKDFVKVDSLDLIKSLTLSLSQIYATTAGEVDLNIDIENMNLEIDKALPFSLIINELLSNSFQHAFNEYTEKKIKISLKFSSDHNYELIVQDSGIGINKDFNLDEPTTLGLKLVKMLVEGELKGEIKTDLSNGTKHIINF